jgi:hypothetical protein
MLHKQVYDVWKTTHDHQKQKEYQIQKLFFAGKIL